MKDTPIVILNKDRLHPVKLLVESLQKRSYNNIIIIDNQSTYAPLFDWYKNSNVDVFRNDIPQTLFDTGAFYRLAFELKHPRFVDIVKTHYVYTDSDVVPIEDAPDDFIDAMIEVQNKHGVHKVGLGLKIDDLPDTDYSKAVLKLEKDFWVNRINDDKYELYHAGIDTTFAIYAPNSHPLLDMNCIRMAGNYMARHIPWYYDINNLPPDEFYYIKNLDPRRASYSRMVKDKVFGPTGLPLFTNI